MGLLVVEHAKVGRRGGGRIQRVHAPDKPAHTDEPMTGEVLEVLVQADLKHHALAREIGIRGAVGPAISHAGIHHSNTVSLV